MEVSISKAVREEIPSLIQASKRKTRHVSKKEAHLTFSDITRRVGHLTKDVPFCIWTAAACKELSTSEVWYDAVATMDSADAAVMGPDKDQTTSE